MKRIIKFGLIGLFVCLLNSVSALAYKVNVEPPAADTVLRVIYYGGIKSNIEPCG